MTTKELKKSIIPDPSKVLKDLEVNASYITNLQQTLILVLSTATEAKQITDCYAKINDLSKRMADKDKDKKEDQPPLSFSTFETSVFTLISFTAYLRDQAIKQKAVLEFEGDLDIKDYKANIESLISASPENIDEEMGKLAKKMTDALTKVNTTSN